MGNIVLLDELTINKIAAGEVIERPASVIKEMLENSIDAGATKVTVEIRNGGISYIKITDNGKGIAQDDLEMAFERHATSKIRTADDLDTVMTMGFRGEALASIAAISSVELISKTENQENGYKVFVEGGHVKEKEEIGCPTGTSITVKNLFFNTPVRYKFLKKDFTEAGYIEDIVTRIALINTNVAIKLVNTGKTVISTPGNGKIKDVIYSIYGKDVAEGILDVDYKYEDIIISGVIGKPENSRSNRSNQLFFVNNRFVKDRILTSATEQAYKNLLEMGKFAFLVLNIEMPTKDVDVNVHPAKLEVRFSNENKIYKAVFHAIQDTLEKFKNNNSTITKVDNLIIQENIPIKETVTPIKNEEEPREKRFSSFLNKRRNKYGLWESNNIIEDLYNKKKTEEVSIDISEIENKEENNKDIIEEKVTDNQEENIVNTSDVLQELRDINNSIKKDAENEASKAELIANEEIAVEENKIEEIEEKKELPDGTTYTYEGENKEKIESLLRQLHPNLNKKEEPEEEVPAVAKTEETLAVAEDEEQYNTENQKFDSIRENLKKLNANIDETIPFKTNFEEEQTQKIIIPKESEQNGTEQNEVEQNTVESNETEQNAEEPKEPVIENETTNNSNFNTMYEKLFGRPVIDDNIESQKQIEEDQINKINAVDIVKDNFSMFDNIEKYNKPTYKIIGIVFGSYIVVEIEKEMYIINEKIARERVLFEKLKYNFNNINSKDSQMLLLPDIINLSSRDMEVAKENMSMFAQAGFVLEEFGENTIKLSGVPTVCMKLNTKELFCQIVEAINTVARTSMKEKENKFIEIISESVVANENSITTTEEVDVLLDSLLKIREPFSYMPNKQVAIKMTKYDIERKFSRK